MRASEECLSPTFIEISYFSFYAFAIKNCAATDAPGVELLFFDMAAKFKFYQGRQTSAKLSIFVNLISRSKTF